MLTITKYFYKIKKERKIIMKEQSESNNNMLYKSLKGNNATLIGSIDNVVYSHSIKYETFYKAILVVPRQSNATDRLPLIIPSRVLGPNTIKKNATYYIYGELRSYNQYEDNKSKLVLAIFAQQIVEVKNDNVGINEINLEGFICKPTIFRVTPLGREISDILIAVNRQYNKSSYIPCISWWNKARYASHLRIGDHIRLTGRFQSRLYDKLSDGNIEQKCAYELSISKLLLLNHKTKNIS